MCSAGLREFPALYGRATRAVAAIVIAVGVLAAGGSVARAASIVFIKGGDVWLAAADGSGARQVTTGGDWSYPSQADDGTIMAQEGEVLYRLNRQGQVLAGPINTIFSQAPPGTAWIGPAGAAISPDGASQAYDGDVKAQPYYDSGCGCWISGDHFTTYWGSAAMYSQPNQTGLGQEDYVDPAWIDNSHLLLTAASDVGTAQVATYTLGNPDNSAVGWFTDNSQGVSGLTNPAITRSGDKIAFIADYNGGLENEIRLYATTGPPPEAAGDPSNLPVDECNIPLTNFSSNRVSFSPDGQSLAVDAPDGIHLLDLTGWPSCSGITDKVIIPGGTLPYFGPADVGANDGCGACTNPTIPPNPIPVPNGHLFSLAHEKVSRGVITLTLSAESAGAFTARASAKHGRHTSRYGSGSAKLRQAGIVKLTIKPMPSAFRALARAGRMLVTVTITFVSRSGKQSTSTIHVTVAHTKGR